MQLALDKPVSQRLDHYIVAQRSGLSRQGANALIRSGGVKVNSQTVLKPSYLIKETDKIKVNWPSPAQQQYGELDIPIIYEDQNCLVIDKPAGILSHSKGGFNPEATVESWLEPKLVDLAGPRAGIVHRLDRSTSGLMILAKNQATYQSLQRQFANRQVGKTYQAIVSGRLKTAEAVIDMPIERHPRKRQTFRTGLSGRSAQTHYRLIKEGQSTSLLELSPKTGRTHQLRVHLAKIGHPIIGDSLYGGLPAKRLYLHATALSLTLPAVGLKIWHSPLPVGFSDALK